MEAIVQALDWSPPAVVPTKYGPRRVRRADVTGNQDFIESWKADSRQWKAKGYSLATRAGLWLLCEWRKEEAKPSVITKVSIQSSKTNKLLDYQVPHTEHMIEVMEKNRYGLDCSEMGTGKTFCALAICHALGLSPFVICPHSVMSAWKRASRDMDIALYDVINYEKVRVGKSGWGSWKGGKRKGKAGKRFEWNFMRKNVCLIFDEVHRSKSTGSQNGELVIASKNQEIPRLLLSGTVAQSPLDMRATGYAIDAHNLHDFWRWAVDYGARKVSAQNAYGGFYVFDKRLEDLERLHKVIFPDKGGRMRKSEIPNFPETQIIVEAYDCGDPSKIQAVYREMWAELRRLQALHSDKSNELTVLLRGRQKSELLKIPTYCEMAKDGIEEGMSVVMFVNFKESVDAVLARMKSQCFIDGRQSDDAGKRQRQRNIDRFQADEEHFIVCNLQAGGVGISLHDILGNRPRLAIISPSFSAIDMQQAMGRVHRAGAKSKSTQKIVYAAGTVEEHVCQKIKEKINQIDTINDGFILSAYET